MSNPYQSPTSESQAVDRTRSRLNSWRILLAAWLLTELFAAKNSVDEGYALLTWSGMVVIIIAGLSQMPGVLIAVRYRNSQSVAILPLLVGSYVIAVTGWGVYAKYAFDGRADSINSAAHLHVVVFPVLHCVFALVVYVTCGLVSAGLRLAKPNRPGG